MPLISRQTGPIAVYGATGYTGRLVVSELAEAGADFVISGRDPEKLDALRADLGLEAPAVAARVDDPASLRSLLRTGALAASQAFDPKDFLARLERFHLRRQADQSERRVPVEA
jgi:short subunit dehydrogenase-like uncharacterized protein